MKLIELKWFFGILLIVSFLVSCGEPLKKPVKEKTVFYYLSYPIKQNSRDTIKYEDANLKMDTLDAFVAESTFFIKDEGHVIRSYTSDNHAATDGGVFYFKLDNLGVIYLRSTTWFSSARLHSNNDSINDLLIQAFSHILLIPKLNGCNWQRDSTKRIKFLEPATND